MFSHTFFGLYPIYKKRDVFECLKDICDSAVEDGFISDIYIIKGVYVRRKKVLGNGFNIVTENELEIAKDLSSLVGSFGNEIATAKEYLKKEYVAVEVKLNQELKE